MHKLQLPKCIFETYIHPQTDNGFPDSKCRILKPSHGKVVPVFKPATIALRQPVLN